MRTKLRCFISLLLLALPATVQAQFIFTTNNGTITITQYTGPGGAVAIPDTINGHPVTVIGADAFYQSFSLTSVTIGTNVTTIGDNAFFQCTSLTNATIPGSVTNIGSGPFVDCQSLTTISLNGPNSHYAVTNGLIFNKTLTSLIQFPGGVGGSYTLSAAVTNVGQAFIGNTLTNLSVNSANLFFSSTNGVLFDKSQTFLISYPGGAGGSYTIPQSVTTIVSASFEYSIGVTNVIIGTNVTSIGAFAFFDCQSLASITVNSTNAFYSSTNGVLFDKNKTLLIQYPSGLGGSYLVPGTVNRIGDGAFGDTPGLTNIVIPNSVTNIGQQAFYSCEGLTSVTLGSGVRAIGQSAFFFCPGLTRVVFPASLASFGFEAFAGCQNLTNACFEGNQPVDGGSVFLFDNALATILHVNGTTGWGATYDGIPTAPCVTCDSSLPELAITHSGTNVIVTWLASFTGYTLQSTTNLLSPAIWITNTPAPVVVNTNNTVTNPVTAARKFYRLIK